MDMKIIKLTEKGEQKAKEIKGYITRLGFYMVNIDSPASRNKFIAECNNPNCQKIFEAKGLPKNWKYKHVFNWGHDSYENISLFCSQECKAEGLANT